jgi:DNA replicative helicase MCM subunit Mcm2 (Cdc46/Mcm family)
MVADMIGKDISHSQDERMRLLLDIVQRLFYDSEENSVNMADIIREAEIHGIEQKETEETLEQLGRYRLINKLPNGKYTLS